MNTIWKISCHELKIHVRNKSFYILLPLTQVLIIMALVGSWLYVQQSINTQTLWQQEAARQWQEQPDRHPHRVSHFGNYAFRAMTPLSFFDVGVNQFVGNSIYLEGHRQNSATFAEANIAGNNLRFSQLSAANLLLIFWPLLLIALAYASITEERESGRLRQLLSNNLPPAHFLTGKMLAYIIISLIFLVPIFGCGLLLALCSAAPFSSDILWRLGTLFLLYFCYSILWLGIIFCCSLVSKHTQSALTFLVVFWLLAVIVTPRLLSSFAPSIYPHPARVEFEITLADAIARIGDSHNPNDPHYAEFKRNILKQYGVQKIEDLPVNYAGLVMSEGEQQSALVFREHYNQLIATFAQQNSLKQYFYWANPFLIMRTLSMNVTASDSPHFYHFEQAAEDYRFTTTQALNELHTYEVQASNNKTQRISREHWKKFPPFSYQTPSLWWSLDSTEKEFLWLLFWLILPLAFTHHLTRTRNIYATV
jgi:ABC-2 type transport system permease protein